jgi:hypothetical protein
MAQRPWTASHVRDQADGDVRLVESDVLFVVEVVCGSRSA